jgi:hypothetical protein
VKENDAVRYIIIIKCRISKILSLVIGDAKKNNSVAAKQQTVRIFVLS